VEGERKPLMTTSTSRRYFFKAQRKANLFSSVNVKVPVFSFSLYRYKDCKWK
jgi:hypothetical protein